MTAEDLLNLPTDNMRHELIHGELTTMPPAGDLHGEHTGLVALEVGGHIRRNKLGKFFGAETGFIVERNPDTVLAPDFAFLSNSRLEKQALTGKFYPGAPDLAVEVLSPSDSASEVLEKIDEWLAAGTRLVWVIDPVKKTLTSYASNRPPRKLRQNETLEGEDVLPGLKLPLSEIFE